MIIFYEKRGFKVQELSYEEIIERYFSSRPLKKEDYETASALIRGVKEKPEGGFLTFGAGYFKKNVLADGNSAGINPTCRRYIV